MTMGLPVNGSAKIRTGTPYTAAMRSAVITSAGDPLAMLRPAESSTARPANIAASVRSCTTAITAIFVSRQSSRTRRERVDLVPEVEVRSRFIEQQQVGLLRKGAREDHALTLAAGQLIDHSRA